MKGEVLKVAIDREREQYNSLFGLRLGQGKLNLGLGFISSAFGLNFILVLGFNNRPSE